MIEQVGQGRMLAGLEQMSRLSRRSATLLLILGLPALSASAYGGETCFPSVSAFEEQRNNQELTQRREGEAILALADAAMNGKPVPSDFAVRWQNDFIKAQRGTFVPFTLLVDVSRLSRRQALVYVRATRRGPGAAGRQARRDRGGEDGYPVDAIFPVEFDVVPGRQARISRGFSVSPGEYDVFVVLRERPEAGGGRSEPLAAVIRQPLSVPDFWSDEFITSSMIVAERLSVLPEPVAADQIAERPYAIGRNEIVPAVGRTFRKDEELIVVFLVYNPMVTPEKHFDVKVEYHFFKKLDRVSAPTDPQASTHPAPRAGEGYFNHTDPQRFNPALMGADFNPANGEPVMAGQVVPLSGFQDGDYRLAVQVIDLLSGKTISRDVFFTVGS